MAPPRREIVAFVERHFPGAAVLALAGDASTRCFYRIVPTEGASRVLMDYGTPFAEQRATDDIRLSRIFRAAGLPVAEILEICPSAGWLLLEDLGDRTLEQTLASETSGRSEETRAWIERAVDLAAEIVRRGTPVLADSDRADGPALDRERFRYEMEFFLEHFVDGFLSRPDLPTRLRPALLDLADRAADCPRRVLCHRDYHSRNLMVHPDGRLYMVDIQDARWGPDTYDLASLLRDGYLEIDESWIEPMLERYRSALSEPPELAEFRRRFDIVSAQRMLKALGTFGNQITVRGRDHYRSAIPRNLRRLGRVLPRHPETSELGELLGDADVIGAGSPNCVEDSG
jgi:aminoglycoside/choline kinase family phosphotransferase